MYINEFRFSENYKSKILLTDMMAIWLALLLHTGKVSASILGLHRENLDHIIS
jgi:hypothetical protein